MLEWIQCRPWVHYTYQETASFRITVHAQSVTIMWRWHEIKLLIKLHSWIFMEQWGNRSFITTLPIRVTFTHWILRTRILTVMYLLWQAIHIDRWWSVVPTYLILSVDKPSQGWCRKKAKQLTTYTNQLVCVYWSGNGAQTELGCHFRNVVISGSHCCTDILKPVSKSKIWDSISTKIDMTFKWR